MYRVSMATFCEALNPDVNINRDYPRNPNRSNTIGLFLGITL